jgi:hypothetical protein
MTGPSQRMNTANYDAWEAARNEYALSRSQELFDYFEDGVVSIVVTIDQTKEVLTYEYLKIWHILEGAGIFMDFRVQKIKDKCRVIIELYPVTAIEDVST